MSETDAIVSAEVQDGILIVRFNRTEIYDIEAAEELAVELSQLAQTYSGQQWVIDLTGVKVIITPVVSGLLSAMRTDRESGGEAYLCGMAESVRRVMELSRLDRVFNTFETLQDALAAAKAAQSA